MQKRIIRIFVSSTFLNFLEERDQLVQNLYRKMEFLCKKNNFSFQIIDLRWGVSKEDAEENLSLQICLDEIFRCQELSPEVNFLAMVGSRCGWMPLPVQIDRKEWGRLTCHIQRESREARELLAYYRQDQNHLGRPYCLLPFRLIPVEYREEKVYQSVRQLLLSNARKYLDRDAQLKYEQSATEQEIEQGYFRSSVKHNAFIMLKLDDYEGTPESEDLRKRVKDLRESLKKSIDQSKSINPQTNQLCIYHSGDKKYISEASNFFTQVITKQIRSFVELSTFQQEQEVLQNTYRRISKEYVQLPEHQKILNAFRNKKGQCILLTGKSGSGKSWLLKYLAAELDRTRQPVAAVFNDIQPLGRNLAPALAFLIETLKEAGLLPIEQIPPQDLQRPVAWFEKVLRQIHTNKTVTILLDCADKIQDYKYADQGLFRIRIPSNVTLIVSAISIKDLHPADFMSGRPEEFHLNALPPHTGLDLLHSLLNRHGRRIQERQEQAVRKYLSADRKNEDVIDALGIELLSQICIRLRSWDDFPDIPAPDFHTLVQIALFHENRDDYRLLRRHALGYLALSSVGLTEAEIIDLLSRDEVVIQEVRKQTIWEFSLDDKQAIQGQENSSYGEKIPFVLWAILYAQMRPFLTDLMDHGFVLLQFRHVRLKEEVLRSIPTNILKILLKTMRKYYQEGEWLLRNGRKIQANRRKVSELFPIYTLLGETDSICRELENPLCVDAYIRCELRVSIQNYLARYATTPMSLNMLGQLRSKDFLFQMWPDSFLSAALSELKWQQSPAARQIEQMIQAGCFKILKINGLSKSREGLFFPQLHSRCIYAMNREGFVAVYMDGMLRIIDMRRGIFAKTVCPSVREACFLYWNENEQNELVIRCEKKRIRYRFWDGQLTEIDRHSCPGWGKLINPKTISSKSGSWTEAEYFSNGPDMMNRHIRYRAGNEIKHAQLFYPKEQEIQVRLRGVLAALILDRRQLEVINLETEAVLLHRDFSEIECVEWASSGRELLVVLMNHILIRVPVDRTCRIDTVPRPSQNYFAYQMKERLSSWLIDAGRNFYAIALWGLRLHRDSSFVLNQMPLLGAMSVRHDRLACYYQTRMGNFLVIYRLSDLRRIFKPMKTDRIQITDSTEPLLYPACDRNGFVLTTGRGTMLLDLEQGRWLPAPPSACRRSEKESADHKKLRQKYADDAAQKMRIQAKLPRKKEKMMHFPYWKLCSAEIFDDCKCKNIWLVDRYHGIIQIFDTKGRCLGKNMIAEKILACDFFDHRLYLLLEESERLIHLSIVSNISHLPKKRGNTTEDIEDFYST